MDPKSKRRGRPLLVAAAGVAFISYVQCKGAEEPVGNLRAPDNIDAGLPSPSQDSGTDQSTPIATPGTPPEHPVGNMMPPPPPLPPPSATPSATVTPIHRPVGNLRAPSSSGSSKKPPPSSP